MDIGSDHAQLLVWLLNEGRIDRGIAIEDKATPYENSLNALFKLPADVRLGDGLTVLRSGEADSLSICGMGAEKMASILRRYPERLPPMVVLQPNRRPEWVRKWATEAGYWLQDESLVAGHWPYHVMSFRAQGNLLNAKTDPVYAGLPREAAYRFGPHLIRRRDPLLMKTLREESSYWSRFPRLGDDAAERQNLIGQVLQYWEGATQG